MLNPQGQYCTNLVQVAKDNGYDFEVLLAIMLTRTVNFASFTVDTDLFCVGIGGTAQEQIFAACTNGLSKFTTVNELNFTEAELETFDLVLDDVRRIMRLKRISDKPQPLPKKPEPTQPKPTPPARQPDAPATDEPTNKPAKKSSIFGLIPWWLWLIPIALVLAVVAAAIFIPGFGPMLLSNVLPLIFKLVFKS